MAHDWIFADIGNTATKLAWTPNLSNKRPWSRQWTWSKEKHDWEALPTRRAHWLVASVQPRHLQWLLSTLAERRPRDSTQKVVLKDIPLRVDVKQPSRLGIDRALSAWAAWELNGKQGPILVVQIGTAVTINLVDDSGVFRGGLIFPSLKLCRQILAERTAALPDISARQKKPFRTKTLPVIGRSTEEAIELGTLHLQVGGIVNAVQRIEETLTKAPTVFASGGGLSELAQWLPASFRRESDLVLRALSMLAKSRQS